GDHLRLDQLDLLEEPRLALVLLLRQRVAVSRRPALERVRDVDVGARQADAGEELVEELAGLPDEWNALLVLVKAGRLADEHQLRAGRAVREDAVRRAGGEDAARTGRGLGPERIEHRRGSLGGGGDAGRP